MSYNESCADSSVLALHNQGLNDEEIAESLDLELDSVKICLASLSKTRRKAEREEKKEDITSDELDSFFKAYKDIALNSENEYLREKALRYLIAEAKGYNQTKNTLGKMGAGGINILVLNNSLKSLKDIQLPSIDVYDHAKEG